MHTSHVSTATRVYLCSAAVTEVQFLLSASITFTDLHSQVGLTRARCALLKNALTPAQPRYVSALVLIYCARLREPREKLMYADDAPCILSPRQRAVLLSGPTPHGTPTHLRWWEEWEASNGKRGKHRDDKTRGCEGKAHSDWWGEGEMREPRTQGQRVC